MASDDAETNETKIDRVMSQRWVDFKRTALRYDDGDEIYEELGDDDGGDYDDYYNDYPQNAPLSVPDSESSQIAGTLDATRTHDAQEETRVSTDGDNASSANEPAQKDSYDASAQEGPSRTMAESDAQRTIATSMPYTAVQNPLGPTVKAREPPKPLNINVAMAQQAATTKSSNTSLDSSIPSSIADHEYSGLNRFGGLLLSENRDPTQLDEVIESIDERDDESGKQQEDERPQSNGLRNESPTDDNSLGSPAAASIDIDARSTSLNEEPIQQQRQYPGPADEYDDNADESIQRSIQNLSLNRPIDSSVSSSETGSVDRTDNGSVRISYAGNSDRRSSYASTSDSAHFRLEDTAYTATTDSNDYFKLHDRSISVGTNRSQSEIMTDTLLEQLAAEQLESRRKSTPREDFPSPSSQKLRIDSSAPGSPPNARSSVFQDRPPIPIILPSITTELDSVKESSFGSEERADDASQQSPVSTVETNLEADDVETNPEADDAEMYYDTSGDPADENGREKEDVPDSYAPTIYLSAPYPGPRWNFKEILKEPNPVKRQILFDAARKMEQRYDSGLDQWLLYMVHQRNDVDPFEMSAVGNDNGKGSHLTIHRTTSMIGHSVSRYSGKSVEMMERVGEKSKGIFHRSKLFGNKMTSEFEMTAKEAAATSARSKRRRIVPFSEIKDMHPVFKDSFVASIRKNTDVSVYMVGSIEYSSTIADTPFMTPTAGLESALKTESQAHGASAAEHDFDVNAILLAYEDMNDSTREHTVDSTTPDSPSDSSPQTLPQHRSLRDFEPTLFTLPKVRSSARIAAMRAASLATHIDKDEPLMPHTSAVPGMTQRRVVTTSALPESKVDLIEIDSITKSFLSKELAVFDEIGNFDQTRPATSSVSVNYVTPKSMLLPESMLLPDTDTPSPRSSSLKATAASKPLPQEPSDEPIVVRPREVPSFELGIPEPRRSEGISSKLKGLGKLKLSKSSPRLQTEKFKQPSDPVAKQQLVKGKELPSLPTENNVVTQVAAAPRNYAKRKPVGAAVHADSDATPEPMSPMEIQPTNLPEDAKPAPPTAQTYIVKPLPMEPGPPHVPQNDILTSGSRRPKAVVKEQPTVDAKSTNKPTDFRSKFRDLMQMDAMGLTPATRTQLKVANSQSVSSGSTSSKSVKIDMRTIKERLTKRTAEHEEHVKAAQAEQNTTRHNPESKEQPSYVQQYEQIHHHEERISASPTQNINESTIRERRSSQLDEGTSYLNISRNQDDGDLGSHPTIVSPVSSPVVGPAKSHSVTRPESLKWQGHVTSIPASDSLQNIVEFYGKKNSEQDLGSPPQITDTSPEGSVTGTAIVTEDRPKSSATSSMLFPGSSAQKSYNATPSKSDLLDTDKQDMEPVSNFQLERKPQAGEDLESEPAVDFTPTSSAGHGEGPRAGPERYRRRRSSMPEWSPIDDNMSPRLRLPSPKSKSEEPGPVLEHELATSSQDVDSQNPDLLNESSVYRHQKSNSDPELAATVAKSSTTNFSGDMPQVIKRSEFERQQAAQRAQNGEPATKIVYVVPDEYVFADRPMYMRAMSPVMQMHTQHGPSGRMMYDPRYRPPPRPGMRGPPPGYMRRPPQQLQQGPPQKWPAVHRPMPQALAGSGQSQRLRPAHMMDPDYVVPMFDSDRIPPGRPHEGSVRGGMMPSREYYSGGYHSPDRLHRPSDEYLARNGRHRPGYATPPLASSPSTASISSAASSAQANSAGFSQGSSSATTANEHMLRMATTPDFDAGSLGPPRRFPKRHL
ncbi:hypothetical protein V1525DRAFT_404442 [Lipomyces kononenkoae]|uniref:Uncharacterized protein n=1 Tax=Lipomyces kononenkoae TaxID=34357 RepID=A0ACC3T2P1_LIPKO